MACVVGRMTGLTAAIISSVDHRTIREVDR